jgi:RNA polymerase sigma-70 factor (ECF subfamily)
MVEKELIDRLVQSDEKAFRVFFDRYFNAVYQASYRILQNREEAEDLAQNVFAQFWAKRVQLDSIHTSLKGWLVIIARNEAIRHFRKNQKAQSANLEFLKWIEDSEVSVSDLQLKLEAAINSLPHKQRLIYTLYKIEGQAQIDIARQLNISLETVRKSVYYASNKIKDAVKGSHQRPMSPDLTSVAYILVFLLLTDLHR